MKFNLILKGDNEFYPKLNNKIYNVLVVNNNDKINFMINKFKEYIKLINEKSIIGLDFEFKKVTKENREISLVQINLENDSLISYIFIFYPPMLNDNQIIYFRKILTNKNIIKIIHGGESLDIPYIFSELLNNNKKHIKQFLVSLYDTKFLCEYYHNYNNLNLKCKIYDILFELKIIDKNNLALLNEIENNMGPIYNVKFDINNLDLNLIKYALYDVIYLPTLINKFINKLSNIKVIQELTCLCYYYKRVDNKVNLINIRLNEMNNDIIIINNKDFKFIEIFYYIYYFELNESLFQLYSKITYFKEFIKIIIKLLVYNSIIQHFKLKNYDIIDPAFLWIKFSFTNIKNIIISLNKIINKIFI
jgi:hypothetical protein